MRIKFCVTFRIGAFMGCVVLMAKPAVAHEIEDPSHWVWHPATTTVSNIGALGGVAT